MILAALNLKTLFARAKRSHSARFGFVVAVIAFAVGFLPLFAGPSYEYSLACGLFAPSILGLGVALDEREKTDGALASLLRGVGTGLVGVVLLLLISGVHAWRTKPCAPFQEVPYFLLTAGIGTLLGTLFGALSGCVGRWANRRRWFSGTLAVAIPVASILLSVVRFYRSPAIFAYDPFVGYFSGTLYDTIIEPGLTLYTYRAGSFCLVVALLGLASQVNADENGVLRWRTRSWWATALGVASFLGFVAVYANGEALDHRHTRESITRALGGSRNGVRCTVHFPNTMRSAEAELLLRDCETALRDVERSVGINDASLHVEAFFFRDAAEKKRLMGAEHTYIAKPWRHEVYLQVAGFPHPVLPHELAHVVSAQFGHGPFRIAGSLGGVLPNPGLIEGFAVAAAPPDDELTDAQWVKAMVDLHVAPSVRRIFSLAFLGENSSKSYTVAGAFVHYVAKRYGWPTVFAWYGGQDIEVLTRANWAMLEQDFLSEVSKTTLSPSARAVAASKFARPSVFARPCPHLVDGLRRGAEACKEMGDYGCAHVGYDAVLRKDPNDFASHVGEATLHLREGSFGVARAKLEPIIANAAIPKPQRDHAEEALLDALLLDGSDSSLLEARTRFERLALESVDEDTGRTFEVKAMATRSEIARAAILATLVGDRQGRAPDWLDSAPRLARWADRNEAGSDLARYLLGKNLVGHGYFKEGLQLLEGGFDATDSSWVTPRMRREAFRSRLIAACVLQNPGILSSLRASFEKEMTGASEGRKENLDRFLTRCALP